MSDDKNITNKNASEVQNANILSAQENQKIEIPVSEPNLPEDMELTFLEKKIAENKATNQAPKDILLSKESATIEGSKRTPVRDPLFASKILEQEKIKEQIKPAGIEKTTTGKASPKGIQSASAIKNIRTYQSDVAEQIKSQKTSVVQMVLEEQKKKEAKKTEKAVTSKRNLPFFIMSIVFVIAGISIVSPGVWYYFFKDGDITKIPEDMRVESIIFAEAQKEFNISKKSKDEIINNISEEIQTLDIRLDFIEHIYPTKEILAAEMLGEEGLRARVTAQEFFKKMEFKMPDTLLRSFGEKFMIGIHSFNGNEPFIILTTDFFENTFAGMLSWEKFMADDIFPLFSIAKNEDIARKQFEDKVIKNRDFRVLTDNEGNIVLLYSFYTKKILIIATSKDTLDEVISRLQRE